MSYTMIAAWPDGRAEVYSFASPVDRDLQYGSMRSFGGPDRLAQSNRATVDDCIQHAERVWGCDSVTVRTFA